VLLRADHGEGKVKVRKQLSVLIVDDDPLVRETLEEMLEDNGLVAQTAPGGEEALTAMGSSEFDAVLCDIQMPGKDGVVLLPELRELRPATPVILMTGYASIDSAVAAMRAGAFDYITKPFKNNAVMASLERAFAYRELEQENRRLRRAVDRTSSFGDLIGSSPAMREIFAMIRKISGSSSNVLITGESGTGKDVVARTIHFTGARAPRPFVPINCTAMPEGLLESELFGHLRGAFTGAHATKRGLFEEADGGTLFLDEIGDMPLSLQSKMLRVLQDHEIRPVGSTRTSKIDVRVIAATNKDLRHEIDAGNFREDLFYRLNVIPIRIPSLRERREDIPLLAQAFVERHAGPDGARLSQAAQDQLLRQRWEGNARELENAIERALALAEGDEIQPEDLAFATESATASAGSDESFLEDCFRRRITLRELSDMYVDKVLREVHGRKLEAARILGLNRRTLYRREESGRAGKPAAQHQQGAKA
jgi:DNA-binding NtrC family response regulator